ncbi:interleukin-23 receptor isoform X1 [Syngnathus acus]|uniref:interleukin-23 receptor isoform X1 n=1 Tax=Syngnathus acus TaxID=161584 RepID=UPI0018863FF4|nr:interleukin-23 receptor isoform X1 [Syngnathus acus]
MTLWRCFIAFLLSTSGPLFGGCQVFDNSLGNLSVEPPSPFLLGSDLLVSCHNKCEWRSKVSLVMKPWPESEWKRNDCSSVVTFKLPDVRRPRFHLLCRLHKDGLVNIVGGLTLQGGWPPDKPENITCETTSTSPWVECQWRAGRNTHVPTSYNVSLSSGNSTWNWPSEADKVVLPKTEMNVNQRYRFVVSADNRFGRSRSDPFTLEPTRILVPQSPRITHIHFGNSSALEAVLHWKTAENSSQLTATVRLRPASSSPWDAREVTRLSQDEVRVDDLQPLVDYHFQIRTCSTATRKCSKWSQEVVSRSPGKGPSQPLRAWRILSNHKSSSMQNVTVLWKAPPSKTFNGQVEYYKVDEGRGSRQVVCATSLCRFSLQVPSDIEALAVSVVTTYGASPPASVPLTFSGDPEPALTLTDPVANGSAILVSWDWVRPRAPGSDELYYIVEWTSVPGGKSELGWIQVSLDQNNASIQGLSVGVRYNISVYAVSRGGVSTPSSILAYSGQLKPDAGPSVSVLEHNATHLLVQWENPPVELQRGFINNYTVYLRTLRMHSQEIPVAVAATHHRKTWLKCPEGAVTLQMSASTAAGEGRRGNLIYSRPTEPAAGLTMVVVPVLAVVAVTVQLACWSCFRQRIKARVALFGPDWLVEELPKPGNSQAIKLLLDAGSEPSFSYTDSDPPLSPISFASGEDLYPLVPSVRHPTKSETCFLETVVLATLNNGYKPQLTVDTRGDQSDQDQTTPTGDDSGSGGFGPILGNLLSGLALDSSSWPNMMGLECTRGNLSDPEDRPPVVDLQSATVVEVSLTGGYIPQICIPSSGQEAE